jgi:uncharacterized protein
MNQTIPVILPHKKNLQLTASFVLVGMAICGGFLLWLFLPSAILPYTFGLFFGYIMQRSSFCFAGCFRDAILIQNTNLSKALLLAVSLTTIGFTLVHFITGQAPNLELAGKIAPVGLHTLAGGMIFGFGMVVAGSCVSGCLVRMGEGYLMQWVTFLGLLVGSAVGAWHLGWWSKVSISQSPEVFFPATFGWAGGIAVQAAIIAVLYRLTLLSNSNAHREKKPVHLSWSGIFGGRKWSYNTGAVMLAIANTLLFLLWKHPWSVTSGLTSLAGWISLRVGISPYQWHYFQRIAERREILFLSHPLIYLSIAMVAGACFASLSRREFRLRRPRNYKYVISALLGGTLMGYGSRVAIGCNIGAFLSGTSSYSLHGWIFGLALIPGAYLGGKYLMRFLVD